MGISPLQRQAWERDGILVLEQFHPERDVEVLLEAWDRAWKEKPNVTIDDLNGGWRSKLGDVNAECRRDHIFKLNDLYLEFENVRSVVLDSRIIEVLADLLGEPPVLCNSLSLERGTQQGNHIDSLYMTPRTTNHLVATWIALEDVHSDAGPLRYFPGSHKMPLYVFRDGTHHASDEEHPLAIEYLTEQLKQHKLEETLFCPKKGDLMIWHANLVHGGGVIKDFARTRRSFVSHFYSESDCRALGSRLIDRGSAYWMHREHLAIPQPSVATASVVASVSAAAATPPAERAAPSSSVPPVSASAEHRAPAQPNIPLRHKIADLLYAPARKVLPDFVKDAARSTLARLISRP